MQPVLRVGKLLDLIARHAQQLEDLELVGETGALGVELAFFGFGGVDGLEGLDRHGCGRSDLGVLAISGEVIAKHLHLADELVCGGLGSALRLFSSP